MKIHNVRLGLATNSSSAHSILLLPKGTTMSPVEPEQGPSAYEWDRFVLVDDRTKRDYLATALFLNLRRESGDEIARTVARAWCDVDDVALDATLDHQSLWSLPREWDGRGIDRAFFEAIRDVVLADGVVIAGGSDNEPEDLPPEGPNLLGSVPCDAACGSSFVARRDGTYWTLFNRDSGAKIRLSLSPSDPSADPIPVRSSAPELVDVKITDFCPFGCAYCYQDSTLEGEHACRFFLFRLAEELGALRVFEVAIGGGEPTLHPHFVEILSQFRWHHVVPNFTTKSLGWLRDDVKSKQILDLAGAFAFSVETAAEVRDLAALLRSRGIEVDPDLRACRRVAVQHVVGVADEEELRQILIASGETRIPITLLGYKQVGRGPQFGAQKSDRWLRVVVDVMRDETLRRPQVGIDTALADRYWDELIGAGVPAWCMTRVEGQFSCYVDAVAETIDVSSYAGRPGIPMRAAESGQIGDVGALYRDLPHADAPGHARAPGTTSGRASGEAAP